LGNVGKEEWKNQACNESGESCRWWRQDGEGKEKKEYKVEQKMRYKLEKKTKKNKAENKERDEEGGHDKLVDEEGSK
jgi:hypothetical protein